ncbi:MAG: glycosyltransferase family 39 protein [Caldilineaceae bacterium]
MAKRWIDSEYLGLALIIILGASLRFAAIGAKAIWLDEAFSIWVAKHSLPEIIQWLIRIDQHPPLYYLLLHYWMGAFGDLQGAVRAFSALCGTLTIPLFYAAGKKFYDTKVGLAAALILAVAPFHVRFAQETRMYALLTLAVAAQLYFLAHVLRNPRAANWRWFGLAGAQAIIMLTHNTATVYFPLALNLAVFLIILLQSKSIVHASDLPGLENPAQSKFVRKWLLFQLLALLIWSVWARAFVVQARGVDAVFWISPPTLDSILATLHTLILAHVPRWFPLYPLADLLFWGLAAYGVYAQRRCPGRAILMSVLFVAPILIALGVSLRRPLFYDRTLIWVTLPLYLLIAAGIAQIGQEASTIFWRRLDKLAPDWISNRAQIGQWLSIGGILALSALALTSYYFYFQKEDWDKAATYLAEQSQPGDMIIFNATWVQLPFEYYFRHYDQDVELRGLPVDLFDRGILEPKMAETDVPYMRQLIANRPRIWLVYSHEWYTDPQRIVVRELARAMQEEKQQKFEGLQILEFVKGSTTKP